MCFTAEEKAAEGFGTVKCKVGQGISADTAACRAVREAIGSSHTLRVDANMGWASVEEAAANINSLAEFDLELVEQPLSRHNYDGLAQARCQQLVPEMLGLTCALLMPSSFASFVPCP